MERYKEKNLSSDSSFNKIRIMLFNNMQKGDYDSLHERGVLVLIVAPAEFQNMWEQALLKSGANLADRNDAKNFDRSDMLIIGGTANIHSVMILPQNWVLILQHTIIREKTLQIADKLKSHKVFISTFSFHNWKQHLKDQKFFLPFSK